MNGLGGANAGVSAAALLATASVEVTGVGDGVRGMWAGATAGLSAAALLRNGFGRDDSLLGMAYMGGEQGNRRSLRCGVAAQHLRSR